MVTTTSRIKNKPGWLVLLPIAEVLPYHDFYLDKAKRLIRQNVLGKREVCAFEYTLLPPTP